MMFYVVNDKTGRGAGSRGYVIDLFLLLLLVLPSLLSVLVCGIAITTALIYHTPMSNGSIVAMTAITVLLLLLLLISSFLSCAPNACFVIAVGIAFQACAYCGNEHKRSNA